MTTLYNQLNRIIDYIEDHIDEELKFAEAVRSVGLSDVDTLRKVFSLTVGVSPAEYIRYRKMTLAGRDIVQGNFRIIDIAMKYGYTSTATFSRAFQKFHKTKPNTAKHSQVQLRFFPKFVFDPPKCAPEIKYEIIKTSPRGLYGIEILSDLAKIHTDAPRLFQQVRSDYTDLSHPDYGMLDYKSGRDADDHYAYSVLWENVPLRYQRSFVRKELPGGRWIKIVVNSQRAIDIQTAMLEFYDKFLPTCSYRLRPEPEFEYYHDGIVDLMVPIY